MTPAVVILAAGASRRMGSCKALVEIDGVSALRRLLLAAADPAASVAPLVITGAHEREIRAELAPQRGVEVLFNPSWESGRTTAVQCAVRARPGADLCLAPVDHPLVPRQVFADLRAAWAEAGAPPRGWLAPRVEVPGAPTVYGHPIVVGRELLAEIGGFPGDRPLRALRAAAAPLLSLPADARVLANLDRPEDLEGFSSGEK